MEKTVFIYGLLDPDSDEIRYIGASIDPEKRFKAHIVEARRALHLTLVIQSRWFVPSPKQYWIVTLLNEGKQPKLVILDECELSDSKAVERKWITELASLGARLTNEKGNQLAHKEWYSFWYGQQRPFLQENMAKIYRELFNGNNDND